MSPTGRRMFRAAKFTCVGVVMLVAPAILVGQMSDGGCINRELNKLQAALRRDRELDSQLQRAFERRQAHDELVSALIAGQATLAETAQRYGEICQASPGFPRHGVEVFVRASSEQERWCKCVLECARMALRERPEIAVAVTVRLDAEWQALQTQRPTAE